MSRLLQALADHFGSRQAALEAFADIADDADATARLLEDVLPEEIRERLRVASQLRTSLNGRPPLASEQRQLEILDELSDFLREAPSHQVVRRIRHDREPGAGPQLMTQANPYDGNTETTAAGMRSRALAAVTRWQADDALKEGATRTIERAGADDADEGHALNDVHNVASHILRFSHPNYISAFRKFTRDPSGGYLADLTPDEARAWREAREHARAAIDTTGAVLPAPIDPTVVLTNAGDVDPMRAVARVDTTTSKTKRYITSAGATFSFDSEGAEVSDDTHTQSEVEITVHKAQGFIQATIEAAMDQPGFDREVAKIIGDGKARLEAAKFVSGSGNGEPEGIVTALAGGASEVSPATAETFASADVYATIEALPARWRSRARWQAELSTINHIDKFETTNGAKLFPRVGDADPVLLRRPLLENSNLDPFSGVDDSETSNNRILAVGDWQQYVILDRMGMAVHFIAPGHLKGENGLPDGRVGWYAYWRVGAEKLTITAFRLLNVATTA